MSFKKRHGSNQGNTFSNSFPASRLGMQIKRLCLDTMRTEAEPLDIEFPAWRLGTRSCSVLNGKSATQQRTFLNHAKIRFFGFLAHCHKAKKLNAIFEALQLNNRYVRPKKISTSELIRSILGNDINQCPLCKKGSFQKVRIIPKGEHAHEAIIESTFQENENSS